MATITLDDVVLEQMQTNQTLERIEGPLIGTLKSLDRNLDNFITLWFASKMDEMEMMRERISGDSGPDVDGGSDNDKDKDTGKLKLSGLAMLAAGLTGAVAGFAAGIADTLWTLLKTFKADFAARLARWGQAIKTFFSSEGALGRAWQSIKNGFKPVTDFFTRMGNFFKTEGAFGKAIGKVAKFFKPITDFAKSFGRIFSKFFGFFRIIGRIFLPITAAFEVISSLYNELTTMAPGSDFLDTFYAVARGIVKGLANIVLVPLDMLKDGVSWLMEKLGFENFAKLLDSFSFSDTFGQIIDWLSNFSEGLLRGIGAAVKAALRFQNPIEAFKTAFNHAFEGGSGGTMPETSEPPGEVIASGPPSGQGRRARREASQNAEGEMTVADALNADPRYNNRSSASNNIEGNSTSGTSAKEMVETMKRGAQRQTIRERMRGDTTRSTIANKIGEDTVLESPTINVINQSNVNAPTSNVTANSGGGDPFYTPSPVTSNGSRADAYSMAW
jgi:hypothetical protein